MKTRRIVPMVIAPLIVVGFIIYSGPPRKPLLPWNASVWRQMLEVSSVHLLAPATGWARTNDALFWTTNDGANWRVITPHDHDGNANHRRAPRSLFARIASAAVDRPLPFDSVAGILFPLSLQERGLGG